jgi:hypothetical protein
MKEERKIDCEWLSVKETAKILGCPTYRIYNSISKLPHKKVENTYFIDGQELGNLLQSKSLDELLPSRGNWAQLTRYLMNHEKEESFTLTIQKIREIVESSSTVLNLPDEWIFGSSKGKSGAYRSVRTAGFDIANMKFAFSLDYGSNVITEITFVKSQHEQKKKIEPSHNNSETIAEQRGLLIPSYSRVFVNFDPVITRVHLDLCYYVSDFVIGKELPEKWTEYETLEEAEEECLEKKGQNWKHCLLCFKKS